MTTDATPDAGTLTEERYDVREEVIAALSRAGADMAQVGLDQIVAEAVDRILASRAAAAPAHDEKVYTLREYADLYQRWMIAAHPWCVCEEGPYFGAQLAGTPLRCEQCNRTENDTPAHDGLRAAVEVIEAVPDLLAAERARRGLSLRDTADQIPGVSFNTLTRMEHRTSQPTADHVVAVLRWLSAAPARDAGDSGPSDWSRLDDSPAASAQMIYWHAPRTAAALAEALDEGRAGDSGRDRETVERVRALNLVDELEELRSFVWVETGHQPTARHIANLRNQLRAALDGVDADGEA